MDYSGHIIKSLLFLDEFTCQSYGIESIYQDKSSEGLKVEKEDKLKLPDGL